MFNWIKNIKFFKKNKVNRNTCTTCKFNQDYYCNAGTHYAEQGLKRTCIKGELWESKK